MKKALAIALLALLLLPFAAHYTALLWQKSTLKSEVKHKLMADLPDSSLVKLTFSQLESQQDLEWEHDKEFEFNENMYDVVRSTQNGDSITYFCWPDHEESSLNKKLKALLQDKLGNEENTGDSKKTKARTGKWEFEKIELPSMCKLHLPVERIAQQDQKNHPFNFFNCDTPPPEKRV